MRFLNFYQWLDHNSDILMEDCAECAGAGVTWFGAFCGECLGTGQKTEQAARRIYDNQCRLEDKRGDEFGFVIGSERRLS